MRAERHKLKKEVVSTFTETSTICLTISATCIMSNILEGCGEPGKAAVAVERTEVQVKRDNAMPRQATCPIISINILNRNILAIKFWQKTAIKFKQKGFRCNYTDTNPNRDGHLGQSNGYWIRWQ